MNQEIPQKQKPIHVPFKQPDRDPDVWAPPSPRSPSPPRRQIKRQPSTQIRSTQQNQPKTTSRAGPIKPPVPKFSRGGGEKGDKDSKEKDKSDKPVENAEDKGLMDGLRENSVVTNPNVHWDDIAGLEKAKESVQEAVVIPIRFPNLFVGERKPWQGILLYGV